MNIKVFLNNLQVHVLIIDRKWDYYFKSEITQHVFFATFITAWIFSLNDCNSRHLISANHLKACITLKFSGFFIFSSLEFYVFFLLKESQNCFEKIFHNILFFFFLSVNSLLTGKDSSRVLIILNYA